MKFWLQVTYPRLIAASLDTGHWQIIHRDSPDGARNEVIVNCLVITSVVRSVGCNEVTVLLP